MFFMNKYHRPQSLILTRGLPASGKTTWALEQVRKRDDMVRVNRDDLRQNVFGGALEGVLDQRGEEAVTDLQVKMVTQLLDSGYSVVVDDNNLRLRVVRMWHDIAKKYNGKVTFEIKDFDTTLEECIRRDKERGESGGRLVREEIIQMLHDKFLVHGMLPALPDEIRKPILPTPPVIYTPDPDLPSA